MYAPVFVLIFLACHVHSRDVDFCYADENDPYLYMGTKTAYHFVHAGKTRFQDVPNCRPQQFWMATTHGTRCPSVDEITEMLELTEIQSLIINNHETRGNGHMCDRDLENLKRWKPDAYLAKERAEVLTPQGVEDMKLLARRLQSNFPDLLPTNGVESLEDYKFMTLDAENSMRSFMQGLFGDRNAVEPERGNNSEPILSGYKACDVWSDEYNNISLVEANKFEEGSEFQNLLQNVSRRLGFLYNISKQSILTMYNMCRYEKAWAVAKLSPWCAVFSKEELRVLEYREDLFYYYKAGYGREINEQLGRELMTDMIHHFWEIEGDKEAEKLKGLLYFTDTITLLNLLTTLNINKDQTPLTAYNYREMAKRQWRTSFIAPFAGNLVAVFYKCNSDSQPHKVMFYLAEKLVLFDGCDVGLCDWEKFKNMYIPISNARNRDVCQIGNGMASSLPNLIVILLSCFSLVFVRK